MVTSHVPKPQRIELILRQLDSLPTLPSVAARLLQLTADDSSSMKEVIDLVASDPALTAKIISQCTSADKGVRKDIITIEKAVKLLGFGAIRNTVLSLKVLEVFQKEDTVVVRDGSTENEPEPFDRSGLWTHALAVGILAELIAKAHPGQQDLSTEQAFVCGLLHDIGKLALDQVLPRSYARVVEICKNKRSPIAEIERSIVGIDHHTAGKRLAEQWGLPHVIQDCMWLHGSPYEALPDLPHRRMVGLIMLSNAIVRRQMLGMSGNHGLVADTDVLIERLGFSRSAIQSATTQLYDELQRRGQAMGLCEAPSQELLMQSIQRANETLGRLNQQLNVSSKQAAGQGRVLETIAQFHGQATPGRSVEDVLEAVMGSARSLFGDGFYAVLYPTASGEHREEWLIGQQTERGSATYEAIDPPPSAPRLSEMDTHEPAAMNLMGLLPWISESLSGLEDVREVRLLPLSSGWGTAALLIHDRPQLPAWHVLHPLLATWGGSIAAAAQHEGVKRLGEALNEANTELAQAQDALLKQQSLARLGEMAAGAAHEMNNPLAVIAGRSQLLSKTLAQGTREQQAAQLVFQESHKLSDLITALHMFANPPTPDCRPVQLLGLLDEVVRTARQARSKRERNIEITMGVKGELPIIHCDPAMIARALTELLLNALQANPDGEVHLSAHTESDLESVVIRVVDDGDGMDGRTLNHAFDPFFSAKPAGRQVGMGLARAQQLVLAHGGRIDLDSRLNEGTTATLTLPIRGLHADTTGTA
jgi:signal transduction histidine kinase/HD-like signal output (HDOD) protein